MTWQGSLWQVGGGGKVSKSGRRLRPAGQGGAPGRGGSESVVRQGLRFRLTHKMRHLEGDLDGILDEAAEGAVLLPPGGLVDELLHLGAVGEGLLDGVGVELLVLQQVLELGLGGLGVAVHQVVAEDFLAVAVHVGRVLVHVKDVALGITHRDGDIVETFKALVHKSRFGFNGSLGYRTDNLGKVN